MQMLSRIKKSRSFIILLLGLGLFNNGFADLYDIGLNAYKNKDYVGAIEVWSAPALKENPNALFNLGRMNMKGLGVESDPVIAVQYYEKSAKLGFKSAQFNLGLAYLKGAGVDKSIDKVMHWWQLAANSGHSGAQYNIAALLWSGKEITQNQALAMKWFRKALVNNSIEARAFIDSLFEPMYSELKSDAVNHRFTKEGKKVMIVEELGAYKLGQQALSSGSFDQAYTYWLPLANDGHLDSQFMLGQLYEQGQGVTSDLSVALDWYDKAARSGQANAQFRLGLYHINEAEDPNQPLGLYWIQSAADKGLEEAIEYMKSGG